MDVVVAGGHGKVGLRLLRRLGEEGHRGIGVIRSPAQAAELEAAGAEPALIDLESDDAPAKLADACRGAGAVVFAAGAGPGSGPERKRTVDLGAALLLMRAAKEAGGPRYAMLSAMGAADPAAGSDEMKPYLQAKAEADAALESSGLAYTIVRPGRLTDEPGTGRVDLAPRLGRRGDVPRDDVAAVLLACLFAEQAVGKTFELLSGDVPVSEAVRSL